MKKLRLTALVLGALLSAAPALAESDADQLAQLVDTLRGAPSTSGQRLFPADLRLGKVKRGKGGLEVELKGSFGPANEVEDELRLETWLGALSAAQVKGGVAATLTGPQGSRKLGGIKRHGPKARFAKVPTPSRLQRVGALSGRRIGLSAGHGWILNDNGVGYRLQRDRWAFTGCNGCRGITEDLFNAEVVANQLLPLLHNMGAEVVLVREADLSADRQIVDDGEAGYTEEGTWGAGNSGGGYGPGEDYRTLAPEQAGQARYAFDLTGQRRVSLRFREGENRTETARLEIQHAGGSSRVNLNQRRMGRFWLDVGAFEFAPGQAQVLLSRRDADGYLIADAVKIGGGTHASGHPWWQMGAQVYVPEAGATETIEALRDVTIRPQYAEFAGADLYVSFHGNASGQGGGSTANGVSTYRYSCQTFNDYTSSEAAAACDDPPGSLALTRAVHGSILEHVRGEWDPNYGNVGMLVADFGELRELEDAPGVLIESGFFDNLASPRGNPPPMFPDNRSMHDPRWREAMARGVAAGIARYFDPTAGAPPERPDHLLAQNLHDGGARLTWAPVEGATSYKVYTATVGRGFDDGRLVETNQLELANPTPRQVYAFRVAALNANGEGYPSQVVAMRARGAALSEGAAADALLLYAYDRRDAWVQDVDNDLAYSVEHAHALAASGDLFFDGALDEGVEAGDLPLGAYALVDFVAGKDSSRDLAVSRPMQTLLTSYVSAGGALLISGEEIGYHLVEVSDDAQDEAFVEDILGATYVSDDAESAVMTGAPGTAFAGMGDVSLDDGTGGVYEVKYPDVLEPAAGAQIIAQYGTGGAAGVAHPGVVFFGTPLEAVVPASARARVFEGAVGYLLPELPEGDLDRDGASDACERAAGLNWRDDSDGVLDLDGDGQSNAVECAQGTDPAVADDDADAAVEDATSEDATSEDATSEDATSEDATSEDATTDVGGVDATVEDVGPARDLGVDALVDAHVADATPSDGSIDQGGDAAQETTDNDADSGCSQGSTPRGGLWLFVPLMLGFLRRGRRVRHPGGDR